MSDHTQYDEARQLRAVISDLKAENRQLRKRIAELEAGQPHIVDPTKFDYTSEGKPVTDLTRSPLVLRLFGYYVWCSDALGRSWDKHGTWRIGMSDERDLIPTPKATNKGDERQPQGDKHKELG